MSSAILLAILGFVVIAIAVAIVATVVVLRSRAQRLRDESERPASHPEVGEHRP